MARDGDLLAVGLILGLGGLGAAYLLLGRRPRTPTPTGVPLIRVDGERVLIFGDSLSHPGRDDGPTVVDVDPSDLTVASSSAPGAVLAARLAAGLDTGGQRAAAVRLNARVGRSARSFLSREDGASLLARDEAWGPTRVVVMLGTNDIDRGTGATALAQTKDALRQIRDAYRAMGAEVVAVGPPSYGDARYARATPTMLGALREIFGADRTLDARPATAGVGRSRDGVHFTPAGAQVAGRRLARALTGVDGSLITS